MPEPAFDAIRPGMTRERAVAVEPKHTVSHTGVPVLGTPMMIGLMESVSHELVVPLLPPGFTTVGYEVCIRHKAPAFVGDALTVSAQVVAAEGRRLDFAVRVESDGKLVGEGTHKRTIIPVRN